MKVGVYVGSFNPVHVVHKKIMNYLVNNKIVDKIIVIPTGNYWDKNNLIDLDKRIHMLKFLENDFIEVNTTLNKFEFTYQILDELKRYYEYLYLIIGEDLLPKFHLWKNIDKILDNKVIVIRRDDLNYTDFLDKFEKKESFIFVDMKNSLEVSSTLIRNKIKNNDTLDLDKYLDSPILDYILQNNLYK